MRVLSLLPPMLNKSGVVVDAMAGIGIRGTPSLALVNAIKAINASKSHIVSISVPAGRDADTDDAGVAAVKPDLIIVPHKKTIGVSKKSAAKVVVVDMGMPLAAELLAGPGDIVLATPGRGINTNKYKNGSVLVVGGSEEYLGAPMLAAYAANNAFAALLTGSGYVTVVLPKQVYARTTKLNPNLIVRSLSSNTLTKADLQMLSAVRHDALLIGPGIAAPDTTLISMLIKAERKRGNTVVADAGAMTAIAKTNAMLDKQVILTPHEGEFAQVYPNAKLDTIKQKVESAIAFAAKKRCTLSAQGQ